MLYLGLSKGLSPSEQKNEYIINGEVLAANNQGSPITILLLDSFQAGLLIKTYYLKIKIIRVFQAPAIKVVRTNRKFWNDVKNYTGMSIFRRDSNLTESSLALPPGSLFIGNPGFGNWVFRDSGKQYWRFHKAYRSYPKLLLWGKFRPSKNFYNKMKIHITNNEPFYGLNNEFGIEGIISKKSLSLMIDQTKKKKMSFLEHFKKYYYIPPLVSMNQNE